MKLAVPDVQALLGDVERRQVNNRIFLFSPPKLFFIFTQESYDPLKDSAHQRIIDTSDRDWHSHSVFTKGQSKRLWAELYKVLDSSDVVIQVLDARDPAGTRSQVSFF